MTPTQGAQLRSHRAYSDAYETGRLFTLRVRTLKGEPSIVITAFDANHCDPRTGHNRIDVEVRHGGKVIFARGDTYCATPSGVGIDGIEAKELVLSLVAMRPGDTDQEYFATYNTEQLDFAEKYGELISSEREYRYCDENGNVRKARR